MSAVANANVVARRDAGAVDGDERAVHLRVAVGGCVDVATDRSEVRSLLLRHDETVDWLGSRYPWSGGIEGVVHLIETVGRRSLAGVGLCRITARTLAAVGGRDVVLDDGFVGIRGNRCAEHAVARRSIAMQAVVPKRQCGEGRVAVDSPANFGSQAFGIFIEDLRRDMHRIGSARNGRLLLDVRNQRSTIRLGDRVGSAGSSAVHDARSPVHRERIGELGVHQFQRLAEPIVGAGPDPAAIAAVERSHGPL